MEWRYIGLVFFVLLETLLAQEGYNYPTPSRPLSGGPEQPGRTVKQPGQGITSSPKRGYSNGISGPGQQPAGQNGYPGRGRPSGQDFSSRPQGPGKTYLQPEPATSRYPGDSYDKESAGKKNGYSRVPGNNQGYPFEQDYSTQQQKNQGFSNQRETTQGYPSQNEQNYPSSTVSDQRYPSTSDGPQSYPGTTQSYPGRQQNQDFPEGYPGQQRDYPKEGSRGYPKQQGGTQGYPSQQRGYPSEHRADQDYRGQQEGYSGRQEFPGQQVPSQRFPSKQSGQNYPGKVRDDQGYSGEPSRYNGQGFQDQGNTRPSGNRGQQQSTNNIFGQGESPSQFEQDRGFPGEQEPDQFEEGDYSAIPGEPDKDYPILSEIPQTSFSCDQQQYPGYYADVEARCQVFHVCANNKTYDFLCPNGTIFHQEYLVCVWWNQFDCNSAPSLYERNANIYDYSTTGGQGFPGSSGLGSPDESQTFEPQGPGGYTSREQDKGYSSSQGPGGYRTDRPAGARGPGGYPSDRPIETGGPDAYPNDRPAGAVRPGGYPSDRPAGARPQERGPSRPGYQESSTGYPYNRPQGQQPGDGGYANGQDQSERYPNGSTDRRPQYSNGRPSLTPRPNIQEPSVDTNRYPSLEPGFPSTTPTETQEGGNGYSNGRPGTSGTRPQAPTRGYLPPL